MTVTDSGLLQWPWELLYHPHPELGFLAQHPWCTIARRVAGRGTKTPLCLPRPFRLLLFIASPEELDAERSISSGIDAYQSHHIVNFPCAADLGLFKHPFSD